MKKHLLVVLSLACGLLVASAASAASLSPYEYTPKQPPVEVDLGVLDEAEAAPPAQPAPAPVPAENAAAPKPVVLIPPAAATTPEAVAPAEQPIVETAPANSTEALLDSVMKHHLPADAKKKPVKIRKPAKPAPKAEEKPAEPAPAAAEAPKAEEKPAEPAPIASETPKAEEKAAEPSPAPTAEAPKAEEKTAAPAPAASEEAKPAEEKPKGPVVRDRRRKPAADETPAAAPAETVTIAFAAGSSELSPEAWAALDTFAAKIKDMPEQRLQILGYAAGDGSESDARRMALSRALMVRSYLIDKGIGAARLDVRALGAEGDTPPSDQVEVVFAN